MLTSSEEVALAQRIERGDQAARQAMIESNIGLVVSIARSHRTTSVPFADLVQEGTLGLVRAVEGFDHRRGFKFSTYAIWWIRRAILDATGASQVIRIPAKAHQQMSKMRAAEADLARIGLRAAPDQAIATRAGLSITTVLALRTAAHVTASLNAPINEDATPLGDLLSDASAVDPVERVIADENSREIAQLLRLLPARHREVIVRRYGLNDRDAQTHEEIGRQLGLGGGRVRQIEREALRRMRTAAGEPWLAA